MKIIILLINLLFIGFSSSFTLRGDNYLPNWKSLDKRPIPRWFKDAKFGIFIHWGIYSVPAWRKINKKLYGSYAEWYYARVQNDEKNGGAEFHRKNYGKNFEYRDFAPMFRAELYDPELWAKLFYRSGAKYVVLTSKHHDGFCLWPTKSPYKKNWNSMDTGPRRDLVGDLAKAVRKKGLKMGLYYSIIEWESTATARTESGYFLEKKIIKKYRIPENEYINNHLIPQLKELVNTFQPAVIFADGGEWDRTASEWKALDFLAWLYNCAPNKNEVVVNDRWGKDMPGKHGDYYSSEYQDTDAVGAYHAWEESRGMGNSYGFNREENIDDYRTSGELIGELIDIVSRGGNLLLNIGPTADGRIPVIMQQRLIDIGGWLKINGEAIYSTRPCLKIKAFTLKKKPKIFLTRKKNTLYVILTEWTDEKIFLRGLKANSGTQVTVLGLSKPVKWTSQKDGLSIRPPHINPSEIPSPYAFVYKITNIKKSGN